MNIVTYIKKNWKKLPKSTFNSQEVVIFKEVKNEEYGYGHHSYEGYGVDINGTVLWCYSSGCSCNGDANTQERLKPASLKKDVKVFEVSSGINLTINDIKDVNFESMQVEFNDY